MMKSEKIKSEMAVRENEPVVDRPSHRLSLEPALIGRDMERAFLEGYLDSARDGQGKFVLVAGEKGIGKTRLIKDFSNHIGDHDEGRVIVGYCYRHKRGTPYYPFQGLLSSYSIGFGNGDTSILSDSLSGEIESKFLLSGYSLSDITWIEEGIDSSGLVRQKMFHNMCQSLLEMAMEKPLLIFIEDIHWADASSLQFLLFLARNISNAKILVVASYEHEKVLSEEEDAYHPLREVLKRMRREMLFEKLELEGLSSIETDKLIRWYFPDANFSDSFLYSVHSVTGGSPYRVRQGLELMLTTGVIVESKEGWSNSKELDGFDLLGSIYNMVKQRLKPLDNVGRIVLECAATIGDRFTPQIISEVTGIPCSVLLDMLAALEHDHRIVHSDGEEYAFDHALIGEVLYRGMSDEVREDLHRKIRNAIEHTCEYESDSKIYDLAFHVSRGIEDAKALSYLEKAGEFAKSCFAFQEALSYFRSGLSLLGNIPEIPDSDERSMRLHVCVGEMNQILGEWEASMENFHYALALTKKIGDEKTEAHVLMRIGMVYAKRSMWSEAESFYNQSIGILQRIGDLEQVGRMVTFQADLHLVRCQWQKAEDMYNDALNVAMRTLSKQLMAKIYSNLGAIADIRGDLMTAILNYSKSLDLYKELEEYLGMAKVYHKLGMMHANGHKWEKALEFYDKCISLSEKIGEVRLTALAHLNKAVASLNLLDVSEAERMCDVAQSYLLRVEDPRGLAECNKVLGMIGIKRNEWQYSQRRFEESIRLLESCGDAFGLAQNLLEIGTIYALRGKDQKALGMFLQSIEIFKKLGVKSRVEELTIRIQTITPDDIPSQSEIQKGQD